MFLNANADISRTKLTQLQAVETEAQNFRLTSACHFGNIISVDSGELRLVIIDGTVLKILMSS